MSSLGSEMERSNTAASPGAGLDLDAEAWLPPELQRGLSPKTPRKLDERATCLVTGATGFIGLELVDCLLKRTPARLICLVRGADQAQAEARMREMLQSRGIPAALVLERIQVCCGDLSRSCLGLSSERWEALANEVDAIFHVGGWINFVYPYEKLRPANVDGTREVLRLASVGRGAPVHFVSSLAVFFGPERSGGPMLLESEPLSSATQLKGGYRQSKWVADRLVQKAIQQGLPATLIRPVRVTGHSITGMLGDPNDLLFSLIRACIRLGAHPHLHIRIPMVPVDYVAEVLVAIAQTPRAIGQAFHLIGAGDIAWEDLWALLHACGYQTQSIPEDEWRSLLETRARSGPDRKDMLVLRALLAAPNNLFYPRPPLDDRVLRETLSDTGIVCPPISLELMRTYMDYLHASGWMPGPSVRTAINSTSAGPITGQAIKEEM